MSILIYSILFIIITLIDGYLKYNEIKKKHQDYSSSTCIIKGIAHGIEVGIVVIAIIIVISIICILVFNQNNIMY